MYHENLTSQLKTLRQWLEAIKAEGFAYAGIEALLGTLDALIQLPGDDGLTHEDFKDLFSRLKSLYYELWLQGRTEDAKAVRLTILWLYALWCDGDDGDDETGLGELVLALKPSFDMPAFVRACLYSIRRKKKKKDPEDDERVEIVKKLLIDEILDFLLMGGAVVLTDEVIELLKDDEKNKKVIELLNGDEDLKEEMEKRKAAIEKFLTATLAARPAPPHPSNSPTSSYTP